MILIKKDCYLFVQFDWGKQYEKVILNIFVMLVNCFRVNKVLNDSGIKKEYPHLLNLISDITDQFEHLKL